MSTDVVLARLGAHLEEGRRLAATTDIDAYEWQCKVGDWYRAGDPLVENALPRKLSADYYWEREHVAPVPVEARFLHMLRWLENVLAAAMASAAPVHKETDARTPSQSTTAEAPDFSDIQSWFEASGFTLPPLPAALATSVRRQQRFVFSTRKVTVDPYHYRSYLEEAMTPEVDDYVLVAHSGHGVNSYALSYYIVWSGLRLLFQLRCGGVYMDAEEARSAICKTFDALHGLWPALSARVPIDPPLVVATSDFYGGCYGRVGEAVRGRWGPVPTEYALERLRHELGIHTAR